MAIFQTILAALGRQLGRLLNALFSWATTSLFGKVPKEKQMLLSVIAFGSVLWIVVVLGVIVPRVGVFLLSFVRLPDWVADWWIRLAMLAAALILPAIIGFVSTKVTAKEDQPTGAKEIMQRVLHGYPYTVATSLALIMMLVFVPILKIRTMAKRWTSEHLPILVEEQDYMTVVDQVEAALDKARMPVTRTRASILVRLPIKVLTAMTGKGKNNLVADELAMLQSNKLEIILHPSDLVISGRRYDAAHARAVITEQLAFSPGYMTWTKEANELEDRLEELWKKARAQAPNGNLAARIRELETIEKDLRRAEIDHEEWDVLFREKLLVERGILQLMSGLTDGLKEPAEVNADELGAQQIPSTSMGIARRLFPRAIMMLAAALLSKFGQKRDRRPDRMAKRDDTRSLEQYDMPVGEHYRVRPVEPGDVPEPRNVLTIVPGNGRE